MNIPFNRNLLSHLNYVYFTNYNNHAKTNKTISNDNRIKHWKSVKSLDCSLFTVDTRPLSVRDLYARAHAPGDVRLPSMFGSLSFVDRRRLLEQQKHTICTSTKVNNDEELLFLLNQVDLDRCHLLCKCHCGQCHRSPLLPNNEKNNDDNGNKELVKNGQKEAIIINGQKSVANSKPTACKMLSISDYGAGTTSRSCECCENEECISPNESSSSSIVTWSSVTSSTFEPFNTVNANQSSIDKFTSTAQKCIKEEINSESINSSFSSSGDYYPSAKAPSTSESNNLTNAHNTTKTIDDFFRKNEMMMIGDNVIAGKNATIDNKKAFCTCSCPASNNNGQKNDCSRFTTNDNEKQNNLLNGTKKEHRQKELHQLSRQTSSNATINQPLPSGLSDYWYWWWWADDENRRRWSSALTGSSPLNPTLLDEMTIWLRENIETRRVSKFLVVTFNRNKILYYLA